MPLTPDCHTGTVPNRPVSPHPELSRRALLVSLVSVLAAACSTTDSSTGSDASPAADQAVVAPTAAESPSVIESSTENLAPADSLAQPTAAESEAPTPTPTDVPAPEPVGPYPFTLGVASGDPDDTSVVLWTRLAPEPQAGGGMGPDPVVVLWEVASDVDFTDVIASGLDDALPEFGHAIHALAPMPANSWAYYRFTADGHVSPVGRTRTFPAPGASAPPLRFGFSSCQNFEQGNYAAHRRLAELGDDVDAFVFLGDYIYEYGPTVAPFDSTRIHASAEAENLDGYRNRYAQYRLDPHLQAHHQARPWIITWDDHEVDNDHAGDTSENNDDPVAFAGRRAGAYQAWYEHMPVRLAPPTGSDYLIYRDLVWGNLARFSVMDGRQYRDDQPRDGAFVAVPIIAEVESPNSPVRAIGPTALDPDHSLFGAEQETWLTQNLSTATERWQLLAQQVMMHGLSILPGQAAPVTPLDTWDGYTGNRQQLLSSLATATSTLGTNLVVLSGDFHTATVGELRVDPFDLTLPVVATEFMAPAISSRGFDVPDVLLAVLQANNPQIKHFDGRNGFVLCEVTEADLTARYFAVADTTDPASDVSEIASFRIDHGTPGISPG